MITKQKLGANALRDLPSDIYNALKRAKKAANTLENISTKHGLKRKFSIDGRFLGDIGELLVHQHFDVILADKQKTGSDGHLADGTHVEIKLRSLSDRIELNNKPALLLVLYICPKTSKWEIVFNGPGHYLPSRKPGKKTALTIKALRELNQGLPTNVRRVPFRI